MRQPVGARDHALRLDLRVAVHAGLRGRNGRIGALVDRRVTVQAVHAEVARMQLVAVGDRLRRLIARFNPFRVMQEEHPSGRRRCPKTRDEQARADHEVDLLRKYLSHCLDYGSSPATGG